MLSLALPNVVPGILFDSSFSTYSDAEFDLFVFPNRLDQVSTILFSKHTTTMLVNSLSM